MVSSTFPLRSVILRAPLCSPRPRAASSAARPVQDFAMNYHTDFKSLRDEVSAEEWQARLDLAACYRLVDTYGMTDLIYNHITARIPGTEITC